MKQSFLQFLLLICFSTLLTSCTEDDNSKMFEQWKDENDAYLTSMKDSSGFQAAQYSSELGKGLYYYKIVKQGNTQAASPTLNSIVEVNYKGMLIDGTVFDATFTGSNPTTDPLARPAQFKVRNLIPGWILNLEQMKPGEIRTFVLPHQLGYGSSSVGRSLILPYSTLRFELHLISVVE